MKYIIFPIIIWLFIYGCTREKVEPTVNVQLTAEEIPDQESWNSTIFFTDSGRTRAILIAGHLRVFSKNKETLLDSNIRIEFYNNEEIHTSTLTAKRGRVDELTNNLYAIDSVVAVNDSGIVITSDEMMWRNKDRKIVSEKYVTIVSPNEIIEGYGFESDQNLRNYIIYNITYITIPDSL
ncbi:MAG: LPS export ABC transporter periplasmic protein LptC [Bacteroidetes bacterium]|nr:LPS export ABC transporter periplasmic protein LptC [Bacteroidota bacterium]